MNPDFNCPYCENPIEVSHDDGFGLREDERHEMECPECEKYFVFDTCIIIHHDSFKADCLNGEPHKLEESKTFPRRYAKMRCTDCDYEEDLPEARLQELIAEEAAEA